MADRSTQLSGGSCDLAPPLDLSCPPQAYQAFLTKKPLFGRAVFRPLFINAILRLTACALALGARFPSPRLSTTRYTVDPTCWSRGPLGSATHAAPLRGSFFCRLAALAPAWSSSESSSSESRRSRGSSLGISRLRFSGKRVDLDGGEASSSCSSSESGMTSVSSLAAFCFFFSPACRLRKASRSWRLRFCSAACLGWVSFGVVLGIQVVVNVLFCGIHGGLRGLGLLGPGGMRRDGLRGFVVRVLLVFLLLLHSIEVGLNAIGGFGRGQFEGIAPRVLHRGEIFVIIAIVKGDVLPPVVGRLVDGHLVLFLLAVGDLGRRRLALSRAQGRCRQSDLNADMPVPRGASVLAGRVLGTYWQLRGRGGVCLCGLWWLLLLRLGVVLNSLYSQQGVVFLFGGLGRLLGNRVWW